MALFYEILHCVLYVTSLQQGACTTGLHRQYGLLSIFLSSVRLLNFFVALSPGNDKLEP